MRLSVVAVTAFSLLLTPAAARAATGLDPVRLDGAVAAGALHRSAVPVTVALAPRHRAALTQAAARGHGLTPAMFNRRYAPSAATVKAVRRWARARGLKVASVSANRTLVRLTGSAARVGRAFGTTLETYKAGASTFYAPLRRARLSGALRGRTTAVLGLSNLGRTAVSPPVRKSAAPLPVPVPLPVPTITAPRNLPPVHKAHAAQAGGFPGSYGPQDIAALYGAPASATGSGQQVAVIAEGDLSQPKADLVTFENRFGLPHVTWNQIQVGAASSDTSGADEWDLDTQYSTGLAPGVTQLNVYDGASLSNDDILATINRWVTDDSTRQASFSAGECEVLAFATGFTDALDVTLAQAAAQGQTLFVSSGDTGVFCSAVVGVNGVPAGIPSVEYPASSPYAVGVGGTTVLGPGPQEIGWYAGGGGTSFTEATPAYQASAGGSFLGTNRGVPDVALDADPNSGYTVIVDGQPETIGGTSASAPSWQGIWARIQGARGGNLGFANPVLYAEPASAFNDVILGANGAPNTPGWDYVTGRGTPVVSALVSG
jgi:subtilase family serine protease